MNYVSSFILFLLLLPISQLYSQDNDEWIRIDRAKYVNQLHGFWLGQSIANWTGLVTEMDKIGNIGDLKTGSFYTRENWGKADSPSIWGQGVPSALSPTIDFVFEDENKLWGSDDDTDIEYMYQYLIYHQDSPLLSAQNIREGWLTHIKMDEENFLWVSNQEAFDLMQKGILPPATSDSANNPHTQMIDAQLTTEIFGLFAPLRPDIALKLADLPIRTVASAEAASIAQFYVLMHSQAIWLPDESSRSVHLKKSADFAATHFDEQGYPFKMYHFIKDLYHAGVKWEVARDSLYERYQLRQEDGYEITSQNLYCNGCFAAGINFGASLISLFWGEGNLKETIKIGALCGWDSDNPTATWGGLIGFMMGEKAIEQTFKRSFSETYFIHRTRQNFPNNGYDTFSNMASVGIHIIDRVVVEMMQGQVDTLTNTWLIPPIVLNK